MALYTRTLVGNLLESGLVGTVGVQVLDPNNAVLVPLRTTGITEFGITAIYSVDISNWDATWSGQIQWISNSIVLASEDFIPSETPSPFDLTQSYVGLIDAGRYFDTRLNTEPWDYATQEQQFKALCTATRAIDRLNFRGSKVNRDQLLQWPRVFKVIRGQTGVGCTPSDIVMATCELALTLLEGIDPQLEESLLHSTGDAYATVRITSDTTIARDHIKAGIPSTVAWRYLLPWLNDPREINFLRG